jgi:hypothetical protein
MAKKVARRAPRRKPLPLSRSRRRRQEQAVQGRIHTAVARAVQQVVEQALEEELVERLGRAKGTRRGAAPQRPAGLRCSRCGLDWAPRFSFDGHYTRTLLTVEAALAVQVPRVRCVCEGTVPVEFATFGRYARCSGPLQERARELAGLCLTLPAIQEVLARDNQQPLACSTLNGWILEAATIADALREGALQRVPAVVMLDGVWVKLMRPTGERYHDARGRQRERVRRVKVPVLVAYGVDPASGARWVLDWDLGAGEDEASWRRLLERLYARGLRADAGLELFLYDGSGGLDAALGQVHFGPDVLRQRCVFHTIRTQWRIPRAASDRLLGAVA